MPSRDRAAYMRAYRAKHRGAPRPGVEGPDLCQGHAERIAFLESEVARLKKALSGKSFEDRVTYSADPPLRTFTEIARDAQQRRDEILRKINRTHR